MRQTLSDKFYRYVQIIACIAPFIGIIGMPVAFYYSTQYRFKDVDSSIISMRKTVEDQLTVMKAYVDAKDLTTNIRIDDLSKEVEKNHYESLLLQQRIDSALNEIMDIEKENNVRLDKIMLRGMGAH